MAKLNLFSEIVDSDTKVWLSWDGFERVCSDDIVNFINSIPNEDETIDLRINCPGGSVLEGFRMYDALRQSGKKITAVVEGLCASMATVILLAAPKDRRYAYPNATFLIHNPEAGWINTGGCPDRLTADEIESMSEKMRLQADALRDLQKKIIDVYVERTGANAEELQKIMDTDMPMTIERAIELGFIKDTLAYNTDVYNINNFKMKENNVEVGKSWLDRLIAKAGFKSKEDVKFNDLAFTSVTGTSFTVEREEGNYAIGDKATPDGKFVMEDGSTVVIANGLISDIEQPKMELKNPESGATISEDEAQNLLNQYFNKITELKAEIDEAKNNSASAAQQIESLTASIAEKDTTIATLNESVVTDEQKSILDIVAKAGGLDWLNAISNTESKGGSFVQQHTKEEKEKFGDGFLADLQKNSRRFR